METYTGHVRTPQDAILLFEATRIGLLPRVQRRLSEKERQQIKSGSVFVWDEREAGMRRWTDGKSWSASRVSGSFLTYREMEGKRGGNFPNQAQAPRRPTGRTPEGSTNGESETEGPDGYRYKPDGLMKQSFSITTSEGNHLHLISYFSRSHSGNLTQPSNDPQLRHIRPPKNMYPEASVNEAQGVTAVTRGPVPESPYMPPHSVGAQSPYSRPGPSPPVSVLFPYHHGPPTPPYPTAYFLAPSHGGGLTAYPQHAGLFYAPQAYHPQGLAAMERFPPHYHQQYQPQPYPQQLPPQYAPHLVPRPVQVPEPPIQQPQPNGHHAPHHHSSHSNTTIPEQGPVLPALNGIGKPASPPAADPKPNDSLNVPSANGGTQNAPPPNRTIPNIHTLLNNNTAETSAEGKGNHSNSRSGSGSPSNNQRPPREMDAQANSIAADTRAISRLNSTFA